MSKLLYYVVLNTFAWYNFFDTKVIITIAKNLQLKFIHAK